MVVKISEHVPTIADLLQRLGDIPPTRIMLEPMPGSAQDADILRYLEAPHKRICEMIDGILVEKPMEAPEAFFALEIACLIRNFATEHDLGLVFGSDAPIRLQLGLVRFPDVSFVSWKRIPDEEFPIDPISKIIPDLAIEVLSPSNTIAEMEMKLDHYFQAGVRLVWIIDPATAGASVYTSRNRVKHVDTNGELNGGRVLPGFKLSLAEVFGSLNRKKRGADRGKR